MGVLQEIRRSKVVVDYARITEAIDRVKSEVDFSKVLHAIHSTPPPEPDLYPVINAIHTVRNEMNFAPVMTEIKESRDALDYAIERVKTEVDMSGVLTAIDKMSHTDWGPIIDEIHQ